MVVGGRDDARAHPSTHALMCVPRVGVRVLQPSLRFKRSLGCHYGPNNRVGVINGERPPLLIVLSLNRGTSENYTTHDPYWHPPPPSLTGSLCLPKIARPIAKVTQLLFSSPPLALQGRVKGRKLQIPEGSLKGSQGDDHRRLAGNPSVFIYSV